MRNKMSAFILKSWLLSFCFVCIMTGTTLAQDGWDFSVGAGVYSENVYTGSDDLYVAPGLLVQVGYSLGDFGFSLNLHEGPSMVYTNKETGIQGKLEVSFDQERDSQSYSVFGRDEDHSDTTKRLLQDTPTVATEVAPKLSAELPTSLGMWGVSVAYHSTSVDYPIAGQMDKDYAGWLYSLSYAKAFPVSETLSFAAQVELTYMNQAYSQAWFSVEYPTPALSTFDADAGFRDVTVGLQGTKMFTGHTGLSLLLAGSYLLEDAADSPYTVEEFQPAAMLYAFYMF